ncbi:chromobox protein homolog 1-like [Ctenocephalides felis]|uniref:chromobox protein homolog 1-like n=1 Tax=Ctenocephalides felis TaxID=7515 RepID=UPI000E6E5988|nr:chromobox protein homolog 1-like [Ctenocephalides felis]
MLKTRPNLKAMEMSKSDSNIFTVDKILDKRVRKGKIEYLIRWENYSTDHDSWEPLENLMCPYTIREYEEERLKVDQEKEKVLKMLENSRISSRPTKLEAEKVLGVTKSGDNLMYLAK